MSEIFDNLDIFEACTVTRFAAGIYVDGIYQDSTDTTLNILASIQDTQIRQGEEQLFLQEGGRDKELVWIWTDTQLFTLQESAAKKADVLTRDRNGVQYEIQLVKFWEQLSLLHYQVLGARLSV